MGDRKDTGAREKNDCTEKVQEAEIRIQVAYRGAEIEEKGGERTQGSG